jgi:DNA-binding IclR family transcriptional regulator
MEVHHVDLQEEQRMSTQSLDRAIGLLRILASSGTHGCRLVDLQEWSGLTKPTIHRLLNSLRRAEFVEQVESTRRYRLGDELAMLGWSARRNVYDLRDLAAEDMAAVAAKTADTSFLALRSSHESVCIDRQTGAYPVKAFIVDVGTRRPLGVGASGVAMLAALDPAQAELVFEATRAQLAKSALASEARVRAAVAAAKRNHYALSDGLVVKGVRAVAVCISDAAGRPVAGISVAAIRERLPDQRIPEMVKILRQHANHIEQRITDAETFAQRGANRIIQTAARERPVSSRSRTPA